MVKARFQQAYVVSAAVGRARRFYEEALGFTTRFADADRWVQLGGDAGKFAIASPEEAGAEAGTTVAVFEVDSLDQAAQAITAHGGRMLETRDMGDHGRTASFLDPDGNRLQLLERRPPSP